MRGIGQVATVLATTALLCASVADDVLAAKRYVTPGGAVLSNCTQEKPCRIDTGVNNAKPGDEILVAPGEYNVTATPLSNLEPLTVVGTAPTTPPLIISASDEKSTLALGPGSYVAGLALTNSGAGGRSALAVGVGSTIERVTGRAVAAGTIITRGSTVRDTAVFNTGSFGAGLYLLGPGSSTIRNLTAISTGYKSSGVALRSDTDGQVALATIRNSILRGTESDISIGADTPNTLAEMDADYSNFRFDRVGLYGEGVTKLGPPGLHNQDGNTVPPALVDQAAGDVTQLPGSPTIDAGLAGPFTGTLDFRGDPRPLGAAIDIGADEFVPPPTGGGAPPIAPPRLTNLGMSRRAFAVAGARKPARKAGGGRVERPKPKLGTKFLFDLDVPATVTVTLHRVIRTRGKARLLPRAWRLTGVGVAGANQLSFSGRIDGRALRPGRYEAEAQASGPGGTSTAALVRFRIVDR